MYKLVFKKILLKETFHKLYQLLNKVYLPILLIRSNNFLTNKKIKTAVTSQ